MTDTMSSTVTIQPHATDTPRGVPKKVGRRAKRLKKWPHPYAKYAKAIELLTNVQPGNTYIYANFRDHNGKLYTKNPISLDTKDRTEAEEMAIEKLAEVKLRNTHGIAIATKGGQKHLFGTYAQIAADKFIKLTADHGLTMPGKLRDELMGSLNQP